MRLNILMAGVVLMIPVIGSAAPHRAKKPEKDLCALLKDADSKKSGDDATRNAAWQRVYEREKSYQGEFTIVPKNVSSPENPKIVIEVKLKGFDGALHDVPAATLTQIGGPQGLVRQLKGLQKEFNVKNPMSGNQLSDFFYNGSKNFNQSTLQYLKDADREPEITYSHAEKRQIYEAVQRHLINPAVSQCEAPDAKATKCEWAQGNQPKSFALGCGTFCTGNIRCDYEKDGKSFALIRLAACKVPAAMGKQVNCGQALACHNDPVNFADSSKEVKPLGGGSRQASNTGR
jgi:hypothetical protein